MNELKRCLNKIEFDSLSRRIIENCPEEFYSILSNALLKKDNKISYEKFCEVITFFKFKPRIVK